MDLSARDYAGRRRDSKWENELAKELRSCTEGERFSFLNDLLVAQPVVALDLARRCLAENASFEILLETALEGADASSMRYWLECVVPRLGFRRVVRLLDNFRGEFPESVEKAAYWLPLFEHSPGFSRVAVDALLVRKPRKKFKPTRTPLGDQPELLEEEGAEDFQSAKTSP
jgi:hypothetical protein